MVSNPHVGQSKQLDSMRRNLFEKPGINDGRNTKVIKPNFMFLIYFSIFFNCEGIGQKL